MQNVQFCRMCKLPAATAANLHAFGVHIGSIRRTCVSGMHFCMIGILANILISCGYVLNLYRDRSLQRLQGLGPFPPLPGGAARSSGDAPPGSREYTAYPGDFLGAGLAAVRGRGSKSSGRRLHGRLHIRSARFDRMPYRWRPSTCLAGSGLRLPPSAMLWQD
jgi:hypothetical protein